MYKIDRNRHDFEKVNLTTLPSRKGGYDILACKDCGLKGKSYQIGIVEIDGRIKPDKVEFCHKRTVIQRKKAQVKMISKNILQFGFIVGEIYTSCDCPDEYKGKFDSEIWVYSEEAGEPVRILSGEYEIVSYSENA